MAIEFLSLDLGCGDFILTNSIAFFYSLGLTSIVTLQPVTFNRSDAIEKSGSSRKVVGSKSEHLWRKSGVLILII